MREAAETRWTCGDLALGAYRPALGGALGRVPPERAAVYPPFTSRRRLGATSLAAKDLIACACREACDSTGGRTGHALLHTLKNGARGEPHAAARGRVGMTAAFCRATSSGRPRGPCCRPPRRRGASATVRLVVREKQQGLEGRPDDVVVRDAAVLGGEGVAHEHVALLLRQLQLAPRNRLEERGWVEQA